ncbi:MAG: trypsin-like peptidase domain-containing protein [Parcubacteria group bacterium]|nr:trypsin-like peptidase domain-containing protein [Parcubacteria group bacterium]
MHILKALGVKNILFFLTVIAVVTVGSLIESPKEVVIHEPVINDAEILEIPATNIEEDVVIEEEVVLDTAPIPEETTPKAVVVPETPEETVEASEEEVIIVPATPKVETKSLNKINSEVAEATVNILCSSNGTGVLQSTTGSGVIIDPKGVIITNAHIAQYLLLKDYPSPRSIECTGRTGSPARAKYTLELLYISKEWVKEHAGDIRTAEPKGTGEHDFALLRVTGRTDPNASLPSSFPYVEASTDEIDFVVGEEMLVRSYPAGLLGGISIQKDLYAVATIVNIMKLYTFSSTNIDLISIGGSIAAQGGSSGGAVIDTDGKLRGIIVTSSREETTGERDLRAITLAHVERDLEEYENTTLGGLLSGDISAKAENFGLNKAPQLTKLLTDVLEK